MKTSAFVNPVWFFLLLLFSTIINSQTHVFSQPLSETRILQDRMMTSLLEHPGGPDPLFKTQQDIDRFLDQFRGVGTKIVGGNNADIQDFPWQISLQLQPQFGGSHFCGGTIIDHHWVITASHCLNYQGDPLEPHHLRIRAGFTSLSAAEQGTYYYISQIIRNPGYVHGEYKNDIALLRISSAFNFDHPSIQKAGLVGVADVTNGLTDYGVMADVSGWGNLVFGGAISDRLQAVQVPIVSTEDSYYGSRITPDMILAGATGKDACQGDSGGPLVVPDGFGGFKLAGVVSWGTGCGQEGFPGVYSRVSHFESWIGEHVLVTDPNQYATHWFEGFEPARADGDLPQGWFQKRNTATDGGLNGNNLQDVTTDIPNRWFRMSALNYPYSANLAQQYVRTGEASLFIHWDSPDFTWAITPQITLPQDTESLELSFWPWINSRVSEGWYTRFYVNVFVDDQWRTIIALDDGTPNMYEKSQQAPLDDFAGKVVQFGFVHHWNDGIQMGIDNVSVRSENQALDAFWRVADEGSEPLEGAVVQVAGVGDFVTQANGLAEAGVFLGPYPYQYTVNKKGYYPAWGEVVITQPGQVTEVVLEKIPAPEILVQPHNLLTEVVIGNQDEAFLNISNPGKAVLLFNAFSLPAKVGEKEKTIKTATYPGYEVKQQFGLQQGIKEAYFPEPELKQTAGGPTEIHYDNGPANGIGLDEAGSWITAVRFTADELMPFYGTHDLGAVKFHIRSNDFAEVILKIWQGGSDQGPGQEIYSARVTQEVEINGFTTHILDQPIPLMPGQDYWLGYSIIATGSYPSSVDSGPMIQDKGGWIFFNHAWWQLTEIDGALDFNWVIRGVLYPGKGVPWLTLNPLSGEVGAGEEMEVLVSFDATGLDPGQYDATITVSNNAGPNVLVPVTMHVVPVVYDVTFVVTNLQGELITDASITLNGIPNPSGDYFFGAISTGTYEYLIIKDGYLQAEGALMVDNQEVLIHVSLIPDDSTLFTLTLQVEDAFGQPVQGAIFMMETFGSFMTDALGEASILVVEGSYNFSLSGKGLVKVEGTLEVDSDLSLQLIIEHLRYELLLHANPPGSGAVSGQGEYYHGEMVSVIAEASDYHSFLYWTENALVVSHDTIYSFALTGSRQLVAHFQINEYTISASAVPSEGGWVAGLGAYAHEQTVHLTAVPANLFQFVEWTEGGVPIQDAGPVYSFEANSNRSLEAHFAIITYSLSFQVVDPNSWPVSDALIQLNGQSFGPGAYLFEKLMPGEYNYLVSREGYLAQSGAISITTTDRVQAVNLLFDNNFKEDPSRVKIFPVPSMSDLNIRAIYNITDVYIADLSGRVLIHRRPLSSEVRIHLGALSAGNYIIRITTEKSTLSRIIQKQ